MVYLLVRPLVVGSRSEGDDGTATPDGRHSALLVLLVLASFGTASSLAQTSRHGGIAGIALPVAVIALELLSLATLVAFVCRREGWVLEDGQSPQSPVRGWLIPSCGLLFGAGSVTFDAFQVWHHSSKASLDAQSWALITVYSLHIVFTLLMVTFIWRCRGRVFRNSLRLRYMVVCLASCSLLYLQTTLVDKYQAFTSATDGPTEAPTESDFSESHFPSIAGIFLIQFAVQFEILVVFIIYGIWASAANRNRERMRIPEQLRGSTNHGDNVRVDVDSCSERQPLLGAGNGERGNLVYTHVQRKPKEREEGSGYACQLNGEPQQPYSFVQSDHTYEVMNPVAGMDERQDDDGYEIPVSLMAPSAIGQQGATNQNVSPLRQLAYERQPLLGTDEGERDNPIYTHVQRKPKEREEGLLHREPQQPYTSPVQSDHIYEVMHPAAGMDERQDDGYEIMAPSAIGQQGGTYQNVSPPRQLAYDHIDESSNEYEDIEDLTPNTVRPNVNDGNICSVVRIASLSFACLTSVATVGLPIAVVINQSPDGNSTSDPFQLEPSKYMLYTYYGCKYAIFTIIIFNCLAVFHELDPARLVSVPRLRSKYAFLLVSAFAVFLYHSFSASSAMALFAANSCSAALLFAEALLADVQTFCQTALLISSMGRKKPAPSSAQTALTALLVTNVALCLLHGFLSFYLSVYVLYAEEMPYSKNAWFAINLITLPLVVCFYFQSIHSFIDAIYLSRKKRA